jgi:hypothetical protein
VPLVQGLVLLLFMSFGLALGWYLGTKRVRRRSIFGDDYEGSPNHRLSTLLYGIGGVVVGFLFLIVTRRR